MCFWTTEIHCYLNFCCMGAWEGIYHYFNTVKLQCSDVWGGEISHDLVWYRECDVMFSLCIHAYNYQELLCWCIGHAELKVFKECNFVAEVGKKETARWYAGSVNKWYGYTITICNKTAYQLSVAHTIIYDCVCKHQSF